MTQEKARNRLILATVIVIALLAITWKFCPLCIHNNDDKILMYLTAGYATGKPEMASAFGSFYWYGIIALCYKLFPSIAWYAVFQLAALISSLIAICYCFIHAEKKFNLAIGLIIFVGVYAGSLMFFSAALQYTATVGIVGGASVCLMIIACKRTELFNAEFVASLIFFFMSYGLRRQFGIVTVTALAIVMFFGLFNQELKQGLLRLIILFVVFEVTYLSNYAYELASGMNEFNDYYAEAGTWNDYPHLPYEGNEKIYKSLGWDQTLYDAASDWFFMDKNVNLVTFTTLNDSYTEKLSLGQMKERATNLLKPNSLANGQVLVWLVMFILMNIVGFVKKIDKKKLLCADVLAILFAVVVVHFLIKGRLPLRAYQSLIYIYFLPFVVLFIEALKHINKVYMQIAIVAICLLSAVAVYHKLPEANMLKMTMVTCNDPGRINDQKQFEALDDYAMNHSDNLYIYDSDLANPIGLFTTYTESKPTNLMQWGGWQYNMPTYWRQLKKNGYEKMGIDQFFDNKVYFCSRGDMEVLQAYVKARVPKANMKLIENIDGVNIYKFTR